MNLIAEVPTQTHTNVSTTTNQTNNDTQDNEVPALSKFLNVRTEHKEEEWGGALFSRDEVGVGTEPGPSGHGQRRKPGLKAIQEHLRDAPGGDTYHQR